MITPDEIWDSCLPRLRRYYGSTSDVEQLAAFVNATPKTAFDWLGGQRATGERLLKLWFFLRAVGMNSPEFNQLDKYNLYIGELYAYDIVTMDRLLEILNVKQTGAVYDIIRGRSPMHPTFLLEDLKPLYDAELAAAKRKVTKVRHLSAVTPPTRESDDDGQDRTTEQLSAAPQPAETTTLGSPVGRPFAVELASSLQSSLVLFRFLDSDECSPELRASVLRLSGDLSEFSKLMEGILARQVD